jgi:hypothetical protein
MHGTRIGGSEVRSARHDWHRRLDGRRRPRVRSVATGLAPLLALALLTFSPRLRAHGGDTSYVVLSPRGATIDGSADLDLIDAEGILRVRRADLIEGQQREVVASYLIAHLSLGDGIGPCPIEVSTRSMAFDLARTRFSVPFVARCARVPDRLDVDFAIFFDAGMVYYLGVVRLAGVGQETQLFTNGRRKGTFAIPVAAAASDAGSSAEANAAAARSQTAGPGAAARRWSLEGFISSVRAGIAHIWSGADHMLFLLALLMTAVVARSPAGWVPRAGLRESLVDVAKIVTGFTLTHSVTLSLAALGLLRPAARVIEPAIAASVGVAAVDNLRPFLRGRKWMIASSLGLLHGFGFASALNELALPRQSLLETLFGFAIGIEVGQFLFVLAFVPAAFALRKSAFYERWVLRAGSLGIAILAFAWMVQRLVPRT